MRQYMDHPTAELMARLSYSMSDIEPRDVLISTHLRFGDRHLFKHMFNGTLVIPSSSGRGRLLKSSDDRIVPASLSSLQKFMDRMIGEIERREPGVRVRLFVASDIPDGLAWVQERWKDRVLPLKEKIPFHSNHEEEWHGTTISATAHRSLIADMVSDWYLLAIADVFMQPMGSSFSETAEHLGFHGPCFFLTSKDINDDDLKKCVDQVVRSLRPPNDA